MAYKMETVLRRGSVILLVAIMLFVCVSVKAHAAEAEDAEEIITRHEDSTSMPLPEDQNLVELQDEAVPLAEVPNTGDPTFLWLAVSGISGAGWLMLSSKQRKDAVAK